MKPTTMKEACRLATLKAGPISVLAAKCLRADHLHPEPLAKALEAAGYTIAYEDKTNGAWAKVYLANTAGEDELKAQGYSFEGRQDALLHAVYGAVREEEATKAVATLLVDRKILVDDVLRATLETRYITHGGMDRLVRDVENIEAMK